MFARDRWEEKREPGANGRKSYHNPRRNQSTRLNMSLTEPQSHLPPGWAFIPYDKNGETWLAATQADTGMQACGSEDSSSIDVDPRTLEPAYAESRCIREFRECNKSDSEAPRKIITAIQEDVWVKLTGMRGLVVQLRGGAPNARQLLRIRRHLRAVGTWNATAKFIMHLLQSRFSEVGWYLDSGTYRRWTGSITSLGDVIARGGDPREQYERMVNNLGNGFLYGIGNAVGLPYFIRRN